MADKNFKVKNGLTIEGGATDTTITADGAGSILVGGSALNFAPANLSINAQTDTSYTAVLADKDRLVEMNNAAANTFTVPADASVNFPVGAQINVVQTGAGQTSFAEGASWTTRTSNFGNTTIRTISYGNSLWVAGGDYGEIRTSTDSVSWTTRNSNFAPNTYTFMLSSAYGNGLFVLGTFIGGINVGRSTDGITWTSHSVNASNMSFNFGVRSIAYGNGIWVAGVGGYSGFDRIRRSTDGITWTTQTGHIEFVRGVAYGNGTWVAFGTGGENSGTVKRLSTSTDAITWVTRTITFGNTLFGNIVYANGLFVSSPFDYNANYVMSSADGITWTTRTVSRTGIYSVNYGNGVWIANGYGGASSSKDLATWTTTLNTPGITLLTANHGNNLWAVGGYSGTLRTGSFVQLNSTPGSKLRAQWSAATLIKRAANTWVATGDLSA